MVPKAEWATVSKPWRDWALTYSVTLLETLAEAVDSTDLIEEIELVEVADVKVGLFRFGEEWV